MRFSWNTAAAKDQARIAKQYGPKYREGWPAVNPLAGDPVMRRDSTDAERMAFNRQLAAPSDSIPRATAVPYSPPTGWQSPSRPTQPGNYVSKYGTASVKTGAQYTAEKEAAFGPPGVPGTQPALGVYTPTLGNPIGSSGPTGSSGKSSGANGESQADDPHGNGYVPGMPNGWRPDSGQAPSRLQAANDQPDGPPAPAENATQRWQSDSTSRYYSRMTNGSNRGADRVQKLIARRIAPGDGNIPGYGTPSARNSNPGPVTFQNSPSNWSPY